MHSWLKIPTLYSFFRNLHIQLPKECAQNKKQWTACINSLRFYETHEQSISHSDDYTRSVQLLWTAGAQGLWRRGVTGVVPVKECGAKENLWPDGRLFVQVCKREGRGSCLSSRERWRRSWRCSRASPRSRPSSPSPSSAARPARGTPYGGKILTNDMVIIQSWTKMSKAPPVLKKCQNAFCPLVLVTHQEFCRASLLSWSPPSP